MYSFSNLEPVCCSMSGSNCCFLTCIQISQETHKVVFPSLEEFSIGSKVEMLIFYHLEWKISPGGNSSKERACQCRRCKRHRFNPYVGKIPWRRTWQPNPVFSPGKSHGQRSLEGYSPWGLKESDITEGLRLSLSITKFYRFPWWLSGKDSTSQAGGTGSIPMLGRSPGEGNGDPLQYSCLGNPMDRGAWWPTVHGVRKESDRTWRLNNNHHLS